MTGQGMNFNGFDVSKPNTDVLEQDIRCEESYQLLAMAIVRSACKARDKKFFYSDWFQMLMPKVDGPALWKQLEKNYEELGKPFRDDEMVFMN